MLQFSNIQLQVQNASVSEVALIMMDPVGVPGGIQMVRLPVLLL